MFNLKFYKKVTCNLLQKITDIVMVITFHKYYYLNILYIKVCYNIHKNLYMPYKFCINLCY